MIESSVSSMLTATALIYSFWFKLTCVGIFSWRIWPKSCRPFCPKATLNTSDWDAMLDADGSNWSTICMIFFVRPCFGIRGQWKRQNMNIRWVCIFAEIFHGCQSSSRVIRAEPKIILFFHNDMHRVIFVCICHHGGIVRYFSSHLERYKFIGYGWQKHLPPNVVTPDSFIPAIPYIVCLEVVIEGGNFMWKCPCHIQYDRVIWDFRDVTDGQWIFAPVLFHFIASRY